jgi:CubicO group peptidase (beta-lactamase class C family)
MRFLVNCGCTVLVFAGLLVPSAATGQQWPTSGWRVSTPKKLKLRPGILAQLDADITSGKYGNTDGMLIIRHGEIAYRRAYPHDYDTIYGEQARQPSSLNAHDFGGPYNYFNPWWHPFYRRGKLHTMQSITKTVTSAVIGVAVSRNEFPLLETSVLKYLPQVKVANLDQRKQRIAIRHLLTMTSGLDWHEDLPFTDPSNTGMEMEAQADWVSYVLNRPMADEPGARFKYNSGATVLLAHIFQKATGQDVEEYAAKYLFAPLGIADYFWKRAPRGLPDTQGGLYLQAHDLAKIGYLFLKNGVWEGKQIVPPAWVKDSLSPSTTVSAVTGVKYGFAWWLYPYHKTLLAYVGLGFGGQKLIVIPEHDLVVVFTGWNIPGKGSITTSEAITRVLAAVEDRE